MTLTPPLILRTRSIPAWTQLRPSVARRKTSLACYTQPSSLPTHPHLEQQQAARVVRGSCAGQKPVWVADCIQRRNLFKVCVWIPWQPSRQWVFCRRKGMTESLRMMREHWNWFRGNRYYVQMQWTPSQARRETVAVSGCLGHTSLKAKTMNTVK